MSGSGENIKMSFHRHLAEDRRLCILRLLTESAGSGNDSVLHIGLEHLGHRRLCRQMVRDDLRFLESADLVRIEMVGSVMVAAITKRGVEVAEGRLEAEGIKKPSIGI